MSTKSSKRLMVLAALAGAVSLAIPAAHAQGSKPPGAGGGGGGHTSAVNNLSYPVVDLATTTPVSAYFKVAVPGTLGKTYSYGCAKEDTTSVAGRTFANTSCASADGKTYYSASQCVAAGMPCEGFAASALDRIYWQKTSDNVWSSDSVLGAPVVDASAVDWGDNLESRSWTSNSVIRVETTPFAPVVQRRGLQMWHVFGSGTNELWGVRATDAGLAYGYLSDAAIVRTNSARLNITKLPGPQPAACPTTNPGPQAQGLTWDGSAWTGGNTFVLYDNVPFTPELNIGGKYVYGFNWSLKSDVVPTEIGKGGWWRLTFHALGVIGFPDGIALAPPAIPDGSPVSLPTASSALMVLLAAEASESGPLYTPVVYNRAGYSLTYIDICVNETKGGGKGRTQ